MIRIFSSHTSDIRSATQSSACSLVCRCEKIPVTLRAAEVDPRRASLESSMRGRLRPAASDAARARAANAEADAPRPMFDSKLFSETTRAWLLILERSLTRSKTVVTCSYLSSSIGGPVHAARIGFVPEVNGRPRLGGCRPKSNRGTGCSELDFSDHDI